MFFEEKPLNYPELGPRTLAFYWLAALAAGFVLTFSVYYPALRSYFVLDDYRWLGKIPFSEVSESFFGSWGHGFAYRPFMRLSFWIDNRLFGAEPLGWHLHSYVLHAANAAWVYLLALKLSKDRGQAGLCALFFTVAPWAHSNVAWISGRTYLLCAFFYLPGLYFALCLGSAEREQRLGRRILLGFLAWLCFTASLMTYEAAVTLPLILLLCLRGLNGSWGRGWRLFAASLVWLGIFLAFRYAALGNSIGGVNIYHQNLFKALTLNTYKLAGLVFWNFRECLIYAAIPAAAALAVWRRKLAPPKDAWLCLAAFFVLYLPFYRTVGVSPRYLYLAELPLIFLCVAALRLLARPDWLTRGLCGVLVFALLFMNVQRGHVLAEEWKVAGGTARGILAQIKSLYPGDTLKGIYIFHNVPGYYKDAGIFQVYFDVAVSRQYEVFDAAVYRTIYLIENPSCMPKELPVEHYHYYNERTGKLESITREQWLPLYAAELEAFAKN